LVYLFYLAESAWGASWTVETVGPTLGTGAHTSIAVGTTGYPCISYYDPADKTLKYARKDSTGWHIASVENTGSESGEYSSLAVDSSDQPRISYYDAVNKDLKYAYGNGVNWSRIILDGTGLNVGSYTSLAISRYGVIGISYYDATNQSLKFIYLGASTWDAETVDGPGWDVGTYSSLAFDNQGNPGISYYDVTNKGLKFAWKDFGGWHAEVVDGTGGLAVGKFSSLVFNIAGFPRISYYDETNKQLKFASKDASGWHMEIVDSGSADVGWNTAMILDKNDNPQMCYLDVTNMKLMYAWKDSSGWHKELIGDAAVREGTYRLVLDRSGKPHISFGGSAGNFLAYATVPDNLPHTVDDSAITNEDTSIDISVLANDSDPDGDAIGITAASPAEHGSTSVNDNGTIRYTPARDFNGLDNFTYTLTDGVKTATGAVCVTVNPANDPPTIRILRPGDSAIFFTGEEISCAVNAWDVDDQITKVEFYQGATLLASVTNPPFNFTWTDAPADNYTITAKAFDAGGAMGISQTIQISVKAETDSSLPTPAGGCAMPAMIVIFAVVMCFYIIGNYE